MKERAGTRGGALWGCPPAPAASAGSLAPSPPAARKKWLALRAFRPSLSRGASRGKGVAAVAPSRRPPWTRVAPSFPSGAPPAPRPLFPRHPSPAVPVGPRARTPRAFRVSRLLFRAVPRAPQPAPRFPSQPPVRRGEGPGPRVRGAGLGRWSEPGALGPVPARVTRAAWSSRLGPPLGGGNDGGWSVREAGKVHAWRVGGRHPPSRAGSAVVEWAVAPRACTGRASRWGVEASRPRRPEAPVGRWLPPTRSRPLAPPFPGT